MTALALLLLQLAAPGPAAPPDHLAAGSPCARCHAAAAGEHARSSHARAFASSSFQRSWARGGRDPWCVGCHRSAPEDGREAEGIGCRGCHQPGAPAAARCAGCHEFAFPKPRASFAEPVRFLPILMQATHTEHRASRGPACARCHMPAGRHTFPGAALAPDALQVKVRRVGAQAEFELSARGVGHAVPTGDPFRRLRVSRCLDAGCAVVVDAAELGREWRLEGAVVIELEDDRPRPGAPVTVRLDGPGDHYRVDLILTERGLPERALRIDEGAIP